MTKQEIRRENLKKRAALFARDSLDDKIHAQLLAQPFYQNARVIMTYISYKSEVDTLRLIQKMNFDKKILCAPVCAPNGEMDAFLFSEIKELTKNSLGILQPPRQNLVLPEEIDLVLVPGCAFCENGYRIGYGGGYYDRYLPKTRATTCGLFYEALKTTFSPEETDIALDFIITEEKLYHF